MAGQNEISGGSSDTEERELTISPLGSPPGAAVTKATPVANLPSAFRNALGSMVVSGWVAGCGDACQWSDGRFAEGDVGEVVIGAVGAERVHERAGLDVAVGARERAPVDVARAAREREGAVDDACGCLVHERLGRLRLGEQSAQFIGGAVGRRVGRPVLIDQVRRARQDPA